MHSESRVTPQAVGDDVKSLVANLDTTYQKAVKEGDGSLLDNCMIVYGSGLSDGNRHLHEDLPTVMVGRGGNKLKTGRRLVARRETPMCNLFLTMMDRMGVQLDHFGDAETRLAAL